MKIFRWLFSNLFLILLIVAVVYGYMFWGNLAGNDTPAGKAIAYLSSEFVEVEEFITAIKEKQKTLQADRETEGSKQASMPADKSFGKPAATAATTKPTDAAATEIKQPPVSISYSQNQRRIKQNSTGVIEKEEIVVRTAAPVVAAENISPAKPSIDASTSSGTVANSAVTGSAADSKNDTFVSTEVEKQLSNVDKHGQVIDASQKNSEIRNTWVVARKSYYQRDYSKSEKNYQKVIDNTEDNFDAYGELGNVYFNQGKNEQAAAAYFKAASILVKKGQVHRAKSLTGLLRHLDKSKAEALQKLIDSTQAEQKG